MLKSQEPDIYINDVVTDDYLTSAGRELFAKPVVECKVAGTVTENYKLLNKDKN
jgi:hypothetical protein